MNRLVGVAPSEVDEESDKEIRSSHQILIIKIGGWNMLANEHAQVDFNWLTIPFGPRINSLDGVFRFLPRTHANFRPSGDSVNSLV